MGLWVLAWGGQIYDSPTSGNIVEIWSNQMAVTYEGAMPTATRDDIVAKIYEFYTAVKPHIDPRVNLDWIRVNEFDPAAPFHQITDPTYENGPQNQRGTGDDNSRPITLACRISMDDGTRNKRARGGFYLPVPSMLILDSWRFQASALSDLADAAESFVNGLNTITGVDAVVWSRRAGGAFPIHRVRVGNVPDNISRRRDNLRESYLVRPIT